MYRFKDGNTLVNVSSSILRHYNVTPFHSSYKPLDDILEVNKNKKIVLFLFDALGKDILYKYRRAAPFIYKNRCKKISSVFPPTTAAATTSLVTSLYPSETGYLGWWSYYQGKLATTFSSHIYSTEEIMNPPMHEILAYKSIFDLINEKAGKEIATSIHSFTLEDSSITGLTKEVDSQLQSHDFIYAYLTEPDHSMHMLGTDDASIIKIVKAINDELESFVKSHPDVLILSIADHSMIDTVQAPLHPDIFDLCDGHVFSIEPRAATFFVKPENQSKFEALARKYYRHDFEIYKKKDVIDREFFGPKATQHPLFQTLLGDYLIVAVKNKCLPLENDFVLKANHAGGTKTEAMIYLGLYNQN